ncbi:cytidine deaminase-like protein [Aspergillus crustosus]
MSANPPPFSTATTAATIAAPLTPSLLSTAAQTILTLPKTAQDTHSKRPFAALLLAPDTTTVLMTSLSLSHVRHAECELARNAADNYTWEYLASCTMVLTWEPCAMCAGTIYWANIGRLVYLAAEAALREECVQKGANERKGVGAVGGRVLLDAKRHWDKHA